MNEWNLEQIFCRKCCQIEEKRGIFCLYVGEYLFWVVGRRKRLPERSYFSSAMLLMPLFDMLNFPWWECFAPFPFYLFWLLSHKPSVREKNLLMQSVSHFFIISIRLQYLCEDFDNFQLTRHRCSWVTNFAGSLWVPTAAFNR